MTTQIDTSGWTEVTNRKLLEAFKTATEIGRVFGVTYREHPQRGDHAPVYARVPGGAIFNTNDFDIPEA